MIRDIEPVTPEEIREVTEKMKQDGYRFVTLTAVDLDEETVDIIYHFDKDLEMRHFRMAVNKANTVPSISTVYFTALLVENEIQDHFGISFDDLVINYDHSLYLEEEVKKTPFCKYEFVKKKS